MKKFLFLLPILLAACSSTVTRKEFDISRYKPVKIPQNACTAPQKEIKESPPVIAARKKRAQEILSKMTLEERAGQIFITGISHRRGSIYTDMNEYMVNVLKTNHPGGIIFYNQIIKSKQQIEHYINDLNTVSRLPLFISVDEEGGTVSRLGVEKDISVVFLPAASKMGALSNPKAAYDGATRLAKDMKALGFNLDFAPVGDFAKEAPDKKLDSRIFSPDVNTVCAYSLQFIKGLQGQGISATLKHFPNIGNLQQEVHDKKTIINFNLNTDAEAILPFKAGIRAGVDFIMTTHVTFAQDNLPITFSKPALDFLKNDLGFKGLIITDDIYAMKSINRHYTIEDAAVAAFLAGHDVIMSLIVEKTHPAIVNAVLDGRITEERLNESVLKILELKLKRAVIK